ncbi:hypothetical protein BAY61_11365 [Prauserella marina]|uniref:Uncharacterized protein n=1 Tax=Prauserella marina TaxID=530584 RepID=A0A222VNL2_9PSEU|nr:alkaline shock response membrane anchor protein AmaP [Prauserella marina]ASR35500.1 hypothetical protein BAY61_11365 [Prauserella marina]PWV84676.1 hypothetical protein DES30_101694 [Prauserella marina]SDC16021.1 hypothetical protein SAMN05421630_101642 [Prauserella marina]
MTKSFSAKALGRSYRTERTVTFTTGLLALLLGAAVLVVGLGWFGTYRARRPVLDPMAVDWLRQQQPTLVRIVVIVAGVAMLVLGLWWCARSLRPERHPDIELDRVQGHRLVVSSSAITEAVRADAEAIDGVTKAKVRAVGSRRHPALRLHVWLREGSDPRQVWARIDDDVLGRARTALGVTVLPTAIRLELGLGKSTRVR